MITQFPAGRLIIILDKSAFQSLSAEEIFQLKQYFQINIPPILVMEVLGDLMKSGTLNVDRVADFSAKLNGIGTSHNTNYLNLVTRELIGDTKIKFFHPLVDTGELRKMADGANAVIIKPSLEEQALRRWKEGNFNEVEKLVSQFWRDSTTRPDLLPAIKDLFEKNMSQLKVLRNQNEILSVIQGWFANPELNRPLLELLVTEFSIPTEAISPSFYRWETSNDKRLTFHAPYSFFCLRTKLLFNLCLLKGIVGTRATNLLDLEYLFYLPFCRIFVSNDKFHKQLAPYLITSGQRFITGEELKADLVRIQQIKSSLPKNELSRAHSEPPRVKDLLIYKLWNELLQDWPPAQDWVPSQEDQEIMHQVIRNFRNSKL